MTRRVAILCAAKNSAYHAIQDVDVYDANRDARTFPGGMPVVAHPPCRSWSAFCAHQAKPSPGERELGLWCVEQVRQWGGVLEQPAHSRLWDAAGLPKPRERESCGEFRSIVINQSWWGYPTRKATWLLLVGINIEHVQCPLRLRSTDRGDHRTMQLMSRKQRSATVSAFAEWLVNLARASSK